MYKPINTKYPMAWSAQIWSGYKYFFVSLYEIYYIKFIEYVNPALTLNKHKALIGKLV